MPAKSVIYETIQTASRTQMIDLTDRLAELVKRHGVSDGFVIIQVPHTTAGCTLQECADPSVQHDLLTKLEQLIPHMETYYEHDEGNSDAHLKTALVGNSVTVLIENGKLLLGRWQGLFFLEFDGPRERRVLVRIVDC